MLILLSLTLSILSNAVSEVSFLNRKDLRELGEESSIHQQNDSHHVRAGFKYYYVNHNGQIYTSHVNPSIKIAATQCVSQTTHYKAAQMIGLMVKHMSSNVFSGIASRGHGIGIFCHNEKVTVFPEFYSLRNKASCGSSCSGSCRSTCTSDGRKMEDLGGVTNSLSGVREDRIICNNFPGAENILVHEFAHQIYNYMPSSDHNRIDYVYNYAKQHHIWTVGTYAMANPTEFWAEATQAFFHVTGRSDVTGGLNMCNNGQYVCRSESEGRAYLQKRDPWLFDELSKMYTNNQPNTPSGLTACAFSVPLYLNAKELSQNQLDREFGIKSYIHQRSEEDHHVRAGFKYYYVGHNGNIYGSHFNPTIKITATQCYAIANVNEFGAEATQAFFHVTGRSDVTGGLNMCNYGKYVCRGESEGRAYLQKRDAWLFQVLSKIYTNNQPNTPSGLTACS